MQLWYSTSCQGRRKLLECGRAMHVSVIAFCSVNNITFVIEGIMNLQSTIGNINFITDTLNIYMQV